MFSNCDAITSAPIYFKIGPSHFCLVHSVYNLFVLWKLSLSIQIFFYNVFLVPFILPQIMTTLYSLHCYHFYIDKVIYKNEQPISPTRNYVLNLLILYQTF